MCTFYVFMGGEVGVDRTEFGKRRGGGWGRLGKKVPTCTAKS